MPKTLVRGGESKYLVKPCVEGATQSDFKQANVLPCLHNHGSMLGWRMLYALAVFSALSFYGYGIGCILSNHMVGEFKRFGLARFRLLTGYLQLAGASGLLLGLVEFPLLGFLAAAGLSLQMFFGLIVRLRMRDNVLQCTPVFIYMCLNALIAYLFIAGWQSGA